MPTILIAGVSIATFTVLLMTTPTDADENLSDLVKPMFVISRYFIWFLVEVITMICNEKRRALHDYKAGTVVINKKA